MYTSCMAVKTLPVAPNDMAGVKGDSRSTSSGLFWAHLKGFFDETNGVGDLDEADGVGKSTYAIGAVGADAAGVSVEVDADDGVTVVGGSWRDTSLIVFFIELSC
ncbi:hypothetical protein Nepgr_008148 [Nepenthes gracilis]|uniref:Uncharacterized protein n=1 Tax=Nepenthes gracilis TaxID=150966 RepID=A0AAD3S8G2_NEPGR|nr:hypothetical protein Nepgr_008148 [Nepenthes gracilis]